ncbi:MAG: flagellar biosynthesis protein FlhA [Candidatus Brocadiia bacterium]|jgi:flagellar biosynthesis protein FlhA
MTPEMNMGRLARNSDVVLALGVVGVLLVLIVPIPTFMVDVLLSLNIAVSLLLLMVALSASKALEFSTFPSLLLFTTLFRLALNVASTRLVLLNGYAGQVINAFGHFVVGGNMVVGLVVFLILCVIQFVVIIKGSGRISEVAARFTLDAMPGKQMAIDADLNAGLINEHQARDRRQKIAQEAEFYGAMDGASKFVRGDAVAGMIIIAVNLIGGIIMGKLRGMAIGDAVQTYSILTVGDGLVTQIPSLIIATTSGIITTKASSSTNLARDVGSELLTHPRALAIGAGIMALFGLIPGLPTAPFLVIAALFMGLSWAMRRSAEEAAKPQPKAAAQAKAMDENAELHKALRVDRMSIEVGYQLIPLLDPSQNDEMLRKIRAVRKQMAQKLGIIVPPIRIHDNLQVKPNEYLVRLRGNELARGTLLANNLLAIDSGMVQKPVKGQETREPAFGLPALWIAPSQKDEAEAAGYTVADPRSVLITHLTEIIRKQAPEILSRDDVKTLVDGLKEVYPTVIEELTPAVIGLGGVQKVLQNLLAEGIPITDLGGILEAIADHAATTKDPVQLTELVRKSIARTICATVESRGNVGAITLDPSLERLIAQCIHEGGSGAAVILEPSRAEQLIHKVAAAVRDTVAGGFEAVLLTSSPIRRHVRRMVQHAVPELPVLAYDELVPAMRLEGRATVTLDE